MIKGGEEEQTRGKLEDLVDSHPDDSCHHFNLAKLLWEGAGDSREKAVEHFVKCARLNPDNAAAFRYLGHYYSRFSVDLQRALKCYQRALSLHPDDSESGEAICDLLDHQGKESLEVAICRDASNKSPRAFWAFRRLGYLLLHQNKWSEAVQSLQHAIRGYPSCADLWEALGLAYQRLGMYTAAIKSYGRATELEESRVFAWIESGNVFLVLNSFRKAIEQFQHALEISPQSISGHYGLALGLLGLSKECLNLGAFRWAASLLEDASKIAKAGACLARNFSCIWKLHGDIQITYAKCFPWEGDDLASEMVEAEAFKTSILTWKRSCYVAAIAAHNSYQQALHLAPWQANIYTDIAISLDLICSLEENFNHNLSVWKLPDKMSLGSLLLESDNAEFWVVLGCICGQTSLKQHAYIRGLQLDISLAAAWAYLGKLYRIEGENILARQAFDRARSIDPSLALPWAGMSADIHARDPTSAEAYESCLRAAQIMPVAEFQIGLGKLAQLSGHLSSLQVFGAIRQAMQRAPHYPETHNLNGLISEAHFNFRSAAAYYRLARHATSTFAGSVPKSHLRDISINLARSLCLAGSFLDAMKECEDLHREGALDAWGLQIYALSLWQVGKNDLALNIVRNLATSVSSIPQTSRAAFVSFVCKLLYHISGKESAIVSIQKMPKELFASSKVSFVVSAIHALDRSNQLESVVASSCFSLASLDEITGMHVLIALGILIKNGSGSCLGVHDGARHLRKALHMYPSSNSIRVLLGNLLLHSTDWDSSHMSIRCSSLDHFDIPNAIGLKSACEILGAAGVACYATCYSKSQFSFPTCGYHSHEPRVIQKLQRFLHQEPWNCNAQYLLILNLVQKAREQRFPKHLCRTLERLIRIALSNPLYSVEDMSCQYQKFQILLSASEICLQHGDHIRSIDYTKIASRILVPNDYIFFAHLLLCRAYAAEGNVTSMEKEYFTCMELKTEFHVGWMCLKLMDSNYTKLVKLDSVESNSQDWSMEIKRPMDMWSAVSCLMQGLIAVPDQDFFSAEELLAQACSLAGSESCLFLCHGAICMQLAKQNFDSNFLLLAVKSLTKVQASSLHPLPIASVLLAQAKASLGSRVEWETNLRLEWFSWPPEAKPAEIFFLMHLLARQPKVGSVSPSTLESSQSPEQWIRRAIHLDPSCLRYWKALQKHMR